MADELNKVEAAGKALVIAWYAHPVPLWAAGVALIVGLLVGRFA